MKRCPIITVNQLEGPKIIGVFTVNNILVKVSESQITIGSDPRKFRNAYDEVGKKIAVTRHYLMI